MKSNHQKQKVPSIYDFGLSKTRERSFFKASFTLIELLVVIAIIGILSGLVLAGLNGATQSATMAKSKVFANSLRDSLGANLISQWNFDGSGVADGGNTTTAYIQDSWSGGNNGTLSATPPTVLSGSNCVSGSCLYFNGSSNYVDFGNNTNLSMGTGDATVSLWVNFDNATAPQGETLAYCGNTSSGLGYPGYWVLRSGGTSQLKVSFSDGTVSFVVAYLSSSGSLVANNWYNIVVVFTRASVAQAYINGVKQAGYSLDISGQQGSITNYSNYRIGAVSSSVYRLAGKMDEVRVFNAAMSTSQIQEQYYAGLKSLLAKGEITQEGYDSRAAELVNNTAKK
jgi:prepilin-type N-terminal cleavage/methylation domain-containing protein